MSSVLVASIIVFLPSVSRCLLLSRSLILVAGWVFWPLSHLSLVLFDIFRLSFLSVSVSVSVSGCLRLCLCLSLCLCLCLSFQYVQEQFAVHKDHATGDRLARVRGLLLLLLLLLLSVLLLLLLSVLLLVLLVLLLVFFLLLLVVFFSFSGFLLFVSR
jgi:hypothetical protein